MDEYIVAYDSRELNIRQKAIDEFFCHGEMTELYNSALNRHKCRKYGDIVGWNNQFWGVVEAESAAKALSVFIEKMKEDKGYVTVKELQND